jgi:hypothetical protein
MCTLTYIPADKKVILTSNRDENLSRPLAYEPREEVISNCRVVYPKDPRAGGTWFAINEYGVVVVLLNGAFVKHQKAGPYTHSRGLVVLKTISDPDPFAKIAALELTGIEPFTLVLYRNNTLAELRWDGSSKHLRTLDPGIPHIWSSVTLYEPPVIRRREALFSGFLQGRPHPHEDEVLKFQSDDHNDRENGFVMKRNDGSRTFSVTQAVFEREGLVMRHFDLRNSLDYHYPLSLKPNYTFDYEPAGT